MIPEIILIPLICPLCVCLSLQVYINKIPVFIAAQFTIAKCWKQLKCPLVNESKNCGTFTQWNTMHRKKEETPTLHYSMDGTGEHYAKWNKPGKTNTIWSHLQVEPNQQTNKQAK